MNYIKKIKDELQKEFNFPDSYIDLLNEYALLVLITGEETTLKNVHDAWSVWKNKTMPDYRSLIPFKDLTNEVQELDREYRDVIVKVAKDLK